MSLPCATRACAEFNAVEQAFLKDPRLIHFERPPLDVAPHFASNENEWINDRRGRRPVDLVLGFATNNVYDVALARKAKGMIIADIAMEP